MTNSSDVQRGPHMAQKLDRVHRLGQLTHSPETGAVGGAHCVENLDVPEAEFLCKSVTHTVLRAIEVGVGGVDGDVVFYGSDDNAIVPPWPIARRG